MDVIESIKRDKAYIKCKLIVKTWEKEFKSTHSRTPSKFDIKEAPSKIKYAYKKYFNLKSEALETSLSVCSVDDVSLLLPEPVQDLERESHSSQDEQLLPALPSGQELEKLLSNVQSSRNSREIKRPTSTTSNSFTDSLSKKLFQNKTFSIRNPRKNSLPKSQQSIEKETTCANNKESLLNASSRNESIDCSVLYNTLNDSTSLNTNCINTTLEDYGKSKDHVKTSNIRQINDGWLERATGISFQKTETNSFSHKGTENFELENNSQLNLNEIPCDYVENSESEEDNLRIDKLKPAFKKRKISDDTSHKVKVVKKNIDYTDKISKTNTLGRKQKYKIKAKGTKDEEKNEQPPDISEYLPFGLEECVTPRHSNVSNVLKMINVPIKSSSKKDKEEVSKLENKILSGTLNDNFVKINIEKKVFVRGKKNKSYSKYKKQQWKDKKALHASMEFPQSGKITCFKCGGSNHMARYCTAHKGDTLLPLEDYNEDQIPTLEDMKNIVSNAEANGKTVTEELSQFVYKPSHIPETFLKMLNTTPSSSTEVKPIYSNCGNDVPKEIYEALQMFGHKSFRPGQERAIMRVLCGLSTLLILSTGGGKSLCYQLPAYIYSKHHKCITLVISPLVSLMEDQVLSMPEFLKAGCLHNNQPPTQRRKIIQCLKDGDLNILLISPEALISGDTSNGFTGLFKSLPPIAFACIDEAHCVSQWSHNFRPSYLMICRVLREKLNVKCILGLTATAVQSTVKSVISHINVADGLSGVITNPTLPDNLCLSVSLEKDKDRALVSYLTSERISPFNSIIVYCIRRDECERVATVLRSCLQESGKLNMEKQNNKRKRMSYIAEAYHAGMSAAQRKKIQKNFMDGTLRIIVATVAFGMGINKPDIRCIIHYNMPSSFESYVQEVGRAGRDGHTAYCHVIMSNTNNDKNELLKHIHANTIDRSVIRKLLQKLFITCECGKIQEDSSSAHNRCKGHEVGIQIDSTIEELDVPSENIATLLCYLELHDNQYIKVLNNAYIICKISSYGGPQKILEAAKICPPLAMAYLIEGKKDSEIMKKSIFEFNVIEVAAAIGWESGVTKYHLKNLEWIIKEGVSRRSQLKVEFNTLGFKVKAPGDLSSTELDNILDELHKTVQSQEKVMLYQLEQSNKAFSELGNYSLENGTITEEFLKEKSNELKNIILNYFQKETTLPMNIILEERQLDVERVTADVRSLIASYKDCNFTGRSIARIFQGISSPNYPAIVWGRCKFWRTHIHEDFYGLVKIATQQIIQMK